MFQPGIRGVSKEKTSSSTNRSPANDFEVDTSKAPPLS